MNNRLRPNLFFLMSYYVFFGPICSGQDELDNSVKPATNASPSTPFRVDFNSISPSSEPAKGSIRSSVSPLNVPVPKMPKLSSHETKISGTGSSKENTKIEIERLAAQWQGLLMMAGISFLPAAVLMTTSFVRIQITLSLLRQAIGSPSIPGNQVLMALSLLLTVIVMRPVGETIYRKSINPYLEGRMSQTDAIVAGSAPLKRFMVGQIVRTGHQDYLSELMQFAEEQAFIGSNKKPVSVVKEPVEILTEKADDYAFHVVAPAFLLSELTTALLIGFAVYLPFLIVDLVVATLLAAMGLWMMPPTVVSTPAKLVLFVLADGWMLTAGALLGGFATG